MYEHLTAMPPVMAEPGPEQLDAIVAAGRELERRQRIRAFIVLAVLAAPVAAAGLLTGAAL